MMQINLLTKNLIQKYKEWHRSLQPAEEVPRIHVDEVASKVASFYEKIRSVVDYREEHLLRKTAIERMLKRRLFLRKDGEGIASSLVLELIRGGHFPNDAIEESKIGEVQQIIGKYIFILNNAPSGTKKEKEEIFDWLLGIAACEIEAKLAPPLKENAILDYMSEMMEKRIIIKEGILTIGGITEEEKKLQIYIACQRALLKLDPPLISFNLLRKRIPNWHGPSENLLGQISQRIFEIKTKIEKDLDHPTAEKFYKACERYDIAYLIVGDILSANPRDAEEKIANPETLENLIYETYQKRFEGAKTKIKRAAIYSTISIFVTKILIAFAIEVPFDIKVTGQFNVIALSLSIAIPPLLMFYLVSTIRPPSEKNASKVLLEVTDIVYGKEDGSSYEIKPAKKRGLAMNGFLTFFYLASFVVSFGLIIKGLNWAGFGILSQIIFIIFISLISSAGVKLRQRAQELNIEKEGEGLGKFLLDLFSLPIIRMGNWMSRQWMRYNIIVVFFNFLLEMPFQLFVEFLEQWRYFLKEKKEEIH